MPCRSIHWRYSPLDAPLSRSPLNPDVSRFNGAVIGAAVFTLLYIAAAAPWAWRTCNTEFGFYIAVMIVIAAMITLIHWRIGLHPAALWALSIWGLAHMAGGLVPAPEGWPINGDIRVLYSLWLIPGYLKYDHVVHAYGFGVTTWIWWLYLRAIEPHAQPTFGRLFLCAAGGMGLGAANEVVEFAATLALPQTNVGGYTNTGWDLVANMVGAIGAAVLIRLLHPRNPRNVVAPPSGTTAQY